MRRLLPSLALVLAGLWASVATAAPKTVMVITSRGCEEVCTSFKLNLESQGPVRFLIRDTAGDLSRVAGFVAEARASRPDLVATWGTGITEAVIGKHDKVDPARHLTDLPVVYMYVGNPVESRLVKAADRSGRPNVAGANTSVPIEAQIKLMRSYRKIERVGMVFNANEPAAASQAAAARKAFEAGGIEVAQVELSQLRGGLPDPADIEPALDQLAQQRPDFLYWVGSAFTLANIDLFSKAATARGMPLFTSLEPAYRKGEILLGLTSPLTGVGQVAAYQAGQVLFKGREPGSLPSPTLTRYSVLINMRAARALKAYPPMKLLQFAETTE